MKDFKNILFIPFFLFINISGYSQTLFPVDDSIDHNDKLRPCLRVNLDPEPKTLKNAWIDFLKDNYDFKLRGMGLFSNKDLLHAEAVTVERVSKKQMDFYTQVVEDETGSEMKVFALFGYDIYVDKEKYPAEYKAIEEMMNAFIESYLPGYYNAQVRETESKIKELKKEIEDLKDDISDNRDDIAKLKEEIDEMNENLANKTRKLDITEKKLRGRQKKLSDVKSKLEEK